MDVYKKLGIRAKEPEYIEVRKSTSFGGVDQWRAEMEDLEEEVN